MKNLPVLPVALACALFGPTASADTAVVLTIGHNAEANATHLGIQMSLQPPWEFLRSPRISTNLEASIGYWRGNSSNRTNESLVDIGLLPVIRFHPGTAKEGRLFFEAGIGAHLLSRTSINQDRRFSTAFQFGDVVGVGWRLGDARRYELGLRLQHISNGGIKHPNQGINFFEFRIVVPL